VLRREGGIIDVLGVNPKAHGEKERAEAANASFMISNVSIFKKLQTYF